MQSQFKSGYPEIKTMKNYCKFYIVRHGETEWNKGKRVMGHLDSPITKEGISQIKKLASIFRDLDFSAVYSSDLSRAFRTAEIILEGRNVSICTSVNLRERNLGRFQGLSAEEYMKAGGWFPEEKRKLPVEDQWKFKLDRGVESDESVVSRFMSELCSIAGGHLGETVLISTHGGPIRMFLMRLGIVPYGLLIPGSFGNCGYLIVKSNGFNFDVEEIIGFKKDIKHEKKN